MNFIEFETKYKVTADKRLPFKTLMNEVLVIPQKDFLYTESSDIYYTMENPPEGMPEFLRFREASGTSKRTELTFKKKLSNKNNIRRIEVNLRTDQNDSATIEAFAEGMGYKKSGSVYKICDIYKTKEVTLVYYSIKVDNDKFDHFIEIELSEEREIEEEEGWKLIEHYEGVLASLGVKKEKRIKQSLYEMYIKKT